ncbi:MAG: hypothetical protein O3C40_25285 [Planctomycetota bacterium]|nr:hypothetical protein [Planctomycetota bacterium]
MSAPDNNTFIDAYGLELNDKLAATYAEPARHETEALRQPARIDNSQPQQPSYRFDAAARRRTLRGPHFDMRRVTSEVNEAASNWDSFDAGIIDVGAAWAPSTTELQPSLENVTEPTPLSADDETVGTIVAAGGAEVEASIEPNEEVAEVAKAVAPAGHSAAEIEALGTAAALPTISSKERFAPVWEVDRFKWPEDIEQLFEAQSEYFDYAGKKLLAASREGLNILAVTSARSGEGSTTLALCLARAAAGAGARVGLLDGNLVRSELGEQLGVDFASGWQSAAAFEQPLAEAAITGLEEGITLFPSAAGPVADIDSLGDERVGKVLRAAAACCELLIIDAGTTDLGENIEALDAAIVVRDIRHTSEAETLAVAAALRRGGVKAVGIAENFGSPESQRAAA